ncbi:hypothetical protein ACTXT7_014009 [Hymenolepis weldensis]
MFACNVHCECTGCRDRLQKLVSLIQSTWPNNDVGLRILDGWIKPPPNLQRSPKTVAKRDSTGRFKQTLHMTVPEELMELEKQNQPPTPPRYYHGGNGLGIKVANSGSRLLMQRPRQNRSISAESPSETHNPRPYPISQDHQWYRQDPNVMGFDNLRRQFKEYPVMMEEFHYAGRALDMILVDTKISASSRQNSVYPGKLAQLAYYGALFDWCYFARQGHVHCSVKPDEKPFNLPPPPLTDSYEFYNSSSSDSLSVVEMLLLYCYSCLGGRFPEFMPENSDF